MCVNVIPKINDESFLCLFGCVLLLFNPSERVVVITG